MRITVLTYFFYLFCMGEAFRWSPMAVNNANTRMCKLPKCQLATQPVAVLDAKTPPLHRLVRLMKDIWGAIAYPPEGSTGMDFVLSDYLLTRLDVKGFIKHFQNCKDCAADNAFLMAIQDDANRDALRLTYVAFSMWSADDDDEGYEWGNIDRSLLKEEEQREEDLLPVFPIEKDDEVVLRDSKEWVRAVIANFGVCPFTMDPNRAGIPMGGVRYSLSRALSADEAFFQFWSEVDLLLSTPERSLSTTLLIFPNLELFGNYELFEHYCDALADALTPSSSGTSGAGAEGLETEVQLVFFHPKFNFRDGQDRVGEGGEGGEGGEKERGSLERGGSSTNYARRSPWPMINLLRTGQVRAAQRGVPTGLVYKQNEERLREIGGSTLQKMLYTRNWRELPRSSNKLFRADEGESVNLNLPLLTSLSRDKDGEKAGGRCPFHPIAEEGGGKGEGKERAEVEVEAEVVAEEGQAEAERGVDYLSLAEQVEQWLSLEEEQRY